EENHIFTGTNQIPETKKVRIYDGYLQTAELPAFGFSSLPWTQSLNVASVLPIGGLSLNDDDVKLTEKSISNEFFAIEIDTAGGIIVSNKK
ncbi:hypothetical protein, partial [Klebsiella pneumoniae]|uniref:hypothetical protein n=1 Tax=Klebsiella pneumoniae TaxID=573 RepID=UPI003B984D4D